jgi:RNA polymerase sigma-70 factor (ECF subfamily)
MLQRFLANEHDFATRAKRGGTSTILPLDNPLVPEIPDHSESPEHAFDRRWALTVMHRAASRLRTEAEASSRADLFTALSPLLASDPDPGAHDAIASQFGLSKGAVAMAIHRLRLRLRELTRDEIADTLSDRSSVDAEMQDLMAALRHHH